jgi:hypothetical protein
MSTVNEQSNTTNYGDTLKGNLFFAADPVANPTDTNEVKPALPVITDSLESSGIKVKVSLTPVKGGYKASIEAIAKPVGITNTTKQTVTVVSGVSGQAMTKTTSIEKTEKKDTQTEGFPWGLLIGAAVLTIIAIFFINKYVK